MKDGHQSFIEVLELLQLGNTRIVVVESFKFKELDRDREEKRGNGNEGREMPKYLEHEVEPNHTSSRMFQPKENARCCLYGWAVHK